MSSARKYSWDYNRCFHIKDFTPGDALIVKTSKWDKTRGVVESVDQKEKLIFYRTDEDKLHSTTLNKIVFLDDYREDWLTSNND